jgi:hypothetical protein
MFYTPGMASGESQPYNFLKAVLEESIPIEGSINSENADRIAWQFRHALDRITAALGGSRMSDTD